MTVKNTFGELFKKYRLKAEIPTLSEFGHLLAEKGFNYEDSIFSHWQNGSRIPQYRILLLKLLEIFVEKKALTSKEQADEFLALANQGSLSEEELKKLGLKLESSVFQVPNEIADFTGREEIINGLINRDLAGKIILIHGPAGVGKTALAIRLGHLLKNKYQDGVLWYKVEEDNIADIFFSIAKVLGEDISGISDLQVRGTVVRSLLAAKNVLLFLDSAELYPDLQILIPNSTLCTTIITSQKSHLKIPNNYLPIKVEAFTKDETLILFRGVLKEMYSEISKSSLLKIADKVGNLPLAIHILAGELSQRKIGANELLDEQLHEGSDLDSAIAVSYKKLKDKDKSVLLSASIFKGKDFSLDSIAYINGLSKYSVLRILEKLMDLSLIEYSTGSRFRIHPAIKDYVRDKLDYPRSSHLSTIAVGVFIFFTIWWIYLQLYVDKNDILYSIFLATYGVVALYGGICGINTSLKWGKTLLGKAIFLYSLGLFMQVFGQVAYSYGTNFQQIKVPYPSIGDIGYFGTILLYIYGTYLLAKSSGIELGIQSFKKKMIAVIIPTIMLALGYYLFLRDYTFSFNNPIKIFLDFGYPFGEAISISIAIITFIFSRTILDGVLKSKAFLVLAALIVQFFADYVFLYDSRLNDYYPGNFVDFIYLISYFIMTLALLSFKSINVKVY